MGTKRQSELPACGKHADLPERRSAEPSPTEAGAAGIQLTDWNGVRSGAELRPPLLQVAQRMNQTNFLQTSEQGPKPAAARLNASTAPGAGPRPCKVRNPFEDAHGFRKCASWKIPTISSKMRTLFQGAHEKLRIFVDRCAGVVRSPPVRLAGMVRSRETAKQIPGSCPSVGTPFGKPKPLRRAGYEQAGITECRR